MTHVPNPWEETKLSDICAAKHFCSVFGVFFAFLLLRLKEAGPRGWLLGSSRNYARANWLRPRAEG